MDPELYRFLAIDPPKSINVALRYLASAAGRAAVYSPPTADPYPADSAYLQSVSLMSDPALFPASSPRRIHLSASRLVFAAALLVTPLVADAQVVTTAAGPTPASILAQVNAYRASLGALNPNVATSFAGGRREINWDGVPDARSAPNNLPANFFNVNSPRGVVFSTPGTGFQVSANAGVAPVRFGNIDPSYSTSFSTFSAQRLFTALGSNILDVNFFLPGTTTAALTRGFAAVYTDVDLANSTSLEFFDAANVALGTYFAPVGTGASEGTFSFLGVLFSSPVVSRVRITSGNTALAAGATDQNGGPRDVVAMDDFIYAEPTVTPEPATFVLLGTGLLAIGMMRRRRSA